MPFTVTGTVVSMIKLFLYSQTFPAHTIRLNPLDDMRRLRLLLLYLQEKRDEC